MKWNTNKIVEDLQKLIGDSGIVKLEDQPQGDYYCRDIFIYPTPIKKDDDAISIIGFNDDSITFSDVDTPNENVPLVEIRNFYSDSDGGLEKSASKKIRELYYIAVDYFNEEDVAVVDNLSDYF